MGGAKERSMKQKEKLWNFSLFGIWLKRKSKMKILWTVYNVFCSAWKLACDFCQFLRWLRIYWALNRCDTPITCFCVPLVPISLTSECIHSFSEAHIGLTSSCYLSFLTLTNSSGGKAEPVDTVSNAYRMFNA